MNSIYLTQHMSVHTTDKQLPSNLYRLLEGETLSPYSEGHILSYSSV